MKKELEEILDKGYPITHNQTKDKADKIISLIEKRIGECEADVFIKLNDCVGDSLHGSYIDAIAQDIINIIIKKVKE